jgi:prevent-host-death family protein
MAPSSSIAMSDPLRERLAYREDLVTTNDLRDHLSHAVNRAARGQKPVIVTRGGQKIAAIISIEDLLLLIRARRKREEIPARALPANVDKIGPAMAQLLKDEIEWF